MEERICVKFFRKGEMTDEEEEILIDFLYNKGIEVNMNTSKKKLCILTLEKKLGSREKLKQFYKDAKNRERDVISDLNGEVYDPNKYGNLTLDAFLKVAMEADDFTLLKLMNISKLHSEKFTDLFFKNYIEKHYPKLLKYRPLDKTYKQYYLEIVVALDTLEKKFDFVYEGEDNDVVKKFKHVKLIDTAKLPIIFIKVYLSNLHVDD